MEVVIQGTEFNEGYPFLKVLLDGEETLISHEQKLLRYGVVYIGSGWVDRVKAYLPKDPGNGQQLSFTVPGGTTDENLVAAVREWREELARRWEDINADAL